MGPHGQTRPAIDSGVLEHLFSMGDDAMRQALCDQLQADFGRLQGAIGDDRPTNAGRAAHELKGLAATVGAERLADMARTLDATEGELIPAARAVMVAALHREIDAVLAQLRRSSPDTEAR